MKLFRKNRSRRNKTAQKLPMDRKTKKAFAVYAVLVRYMVFGTTTALTANDPTAAINNLSDSAFGLIKVVGMIMLDFGIIRVGLSLKSHDPSQRADGFLTLTGDIMITFTKEVLALTTG